MQPTETIPPTRLACLRTLNPTAVLVAFLLLGSLLTVCNFEYRLANWYTDNGAVGYAHLYKTPELFAGDWYAIWGNAALVGTVLNWGPALLWRYLNIDPRIVAAALTLLQAVLTGLSAYWLVWWISRRRPIAVFAALFAYVFRPWSWNLAHYDAGDTSPYYEGLMGIFIVLLALAFVLQGRPPLVLAALLASALVHPMLGLFGCGMAGLYWLWEGLERRDRSVVWRLAGPAVIVGIAVLPGYLTLRQIQQPISHEDLVTATLSYHHFMLLYWLSDFPFRIPVQWLFLLQAFVLAFLGWRYRADFSKEAQKLWLVVLVGAVLLTLTGVLGEVIRSPDLVRMAGGRATAFVSMVSLPWILNYGWQLRKDNPLALVVFLALFAITLIFNPVTDVYATLLPPLPLMAVLVLLELSQGHLGPWQFRLPSKFWPDLMYGLAIAVLLAGFWLINRLFDYPAYFLPLLSAALLIARLLARRSVKIAWKAQYERVAMAVVVIMGIGLAVSVVYLFYRSSALTPERMAAYDAQVWARDHTPIGTKFMSYEVIQWRTVSLRPLYFPYPVTYYVYYPDQRLKDFNDRILDFYGVPRDLATTPGLDTYKLLKERYDALSEADLVRLAQQNAVSYGVFPKSRRLNLPVAYANDLLVIYDMTP